MKLALVICSVLAGILTLVVSLPIARADTIRWRPLAWIRRKRLLIALSALAISMIFGVLAVIDKAHDVFTVARGPQGQLATSASVAAVEREIDAIARVQAGEAREFFRSGETLMHAQEFAAAAASYRRSAERVPTKAALTNLALCARFASNLKESAEAARQAIGLPEREGADKSLHANALLQLGITLMEAGERDEARVYLADALHRFELSHNDVGRAAAEYSFGVFQFRGGNPAAATRLLSSAGSRFERQGDKFGQASALNVLSVIQLEAGATTDGIASLASAGALFKEAAYPIGEAGALLNIGSARQDRCELDAALSAYSDCAAAAKKINNTFLVALATVNASLAVLEQGDIDSAERKARDALKLCEAITAPEIEGWAHLSLGSIQRIRGNEAEAKAELEHARAKFQNITVIGVFLVTLEEAKLAVKMHRYDDATLLIARASDAMKASDSYLYEPDVAEVRADLWEAKNDKGNAAKVLSAAHAVIRQHGMNTCAARRIESRLNDSKGAS